MTQQNFIDLGLSVKWASCNVGASSPEEYGNYYTFDEAKELGVKMPTKEEMNELINNCTWTWTYVNDRAGYKVTGPNGNSIFLPAAGYRDITGVCDRGSNGFYWSGSLYRNDSNYAYYLYFDSSFYDWYSYYRNYGHSVRPVSK